MSDRIDGASIDEASIDDLSDEQVRERLENPPPYVVARFTYPIFVDPPDLDCAGRRRLQAVKDAWATFNRTGDNSELIALGQLPEGDPREWR